MQHRFRAEHVHYTQFLSLSQLRPSAYSVRVATLFGPIALVYGFHVTLILKIHLAPLDSTARVILLKRKVVPSLGIRLNCSLRTQLKNVPMTNGMNLPKSFWRTDIHEPRLLLYVGGCP